MNIKLSKCGFFENIPAGDVNDLISSWENISKSYLWRLDELECNNCAALSDCKGEFQVHDKTL